MLMDIEAAQDAETIARLKKERHDLKFELYQLRQRVDILEQENLECKKCLGTMNATITMQFHLINALCDLTKGLADDVAMIAKEEKK